MKHHINTKFMLLAAVATASGIVSATFVPAANAIECRGRYQVVSGNLVATSYCEDNYLARVARKYGARVSNSQIRNNPNTKEEVCRLVRHDNRVSGICSDSYSGKRHWNN